MAAFTKFNPIYLSLEIEEKNTRVITRLKTFQKNVSFYIESLTEGDIQEIDSSLAEVQKSIVSLNRELAKNEKNFTVLNIFNSDNLNEIVQHWIKFTMKYPIFWVHVKDEEYLEAGKCLRDFHDFPL